MKNKLDILFGQKKKNVLNMYCTAGFPQLNSTVEVILSLQQNGADIIEVGMPYSDPIADGPVIQESNTRALENGINIGLTLQQLKERKDEVKVPLILMGYLNPVLQFGFENFCREAAEAGVSGLIIPDIPVDAFDKEYKKIIDKYNLAFIFLITPSTPVARIKALDKRSKGFLYAVSSPGITGKQTAIDSQKTYFESLKKLKLKNPLLIGFGIRDRETFENACNYATGAIIGSAYIQALMQNTNVQETTEAFMKSIRTD